MAPSAKYLLYNTATQVIILISVAKRIRQIYFSPLLDAVVTTSSMIFLQINESVLIVMCTALKLETFGGDPHRHLL
jgi:hypothetical protein